MVKSKLPPIGKAAFVDVETTGLNPGRDKVIELCIVLISFDRDTGRIHDGIEYYSGFQDPGRKIPTRATEVNHITDDDVRGQQIDMPTVEGMLRACEFIVSHNAEFDRSFIGPLFHTAYEKPWKCSMQQIPWRKCGFERRSLEYLLDEHLIFRENEHRATDDTIALIKLMTLTDPSTGDTYFHHLLKKRALISAIKTG